MAHPKLHSRALPLKDQAAASWINQVERWFAELTRKQLQRGVHRSVAELEADIVAFIETTQ